MTNSLVTPPKTKQWPYLLLLYVSFIWIVLYPTFITVVGSDIFGYGNVLNLNSSLFSYVLLSILFNGLIYFVEFELIFWIYRLILSFKIYYFIVPTDRLKIESRKYFIIRNIIYGLFVNLCFFYPFFFNYIEFINVIVTMTMVFFFIKHINKTYSEPIVSHFVFRYFCYPIFIFVGLSILVSVMGVV